jgi:transposase-like protein
VAADPVRGVDYPATYQQLLRWFPDNDACLEYLGRLRWEDGFVCPACGGDRFWRTGAGLWMCRACQRRTSVTAGTIFHRTRTPMSTWFAAIWFVTSQKNGVSAQGLQRVLGFGSYETAWAWLHKLRRAMVRPDRDRLSGTVEVDETMVGGVTPGMFGAATGKVPVMIAVERNNHRDTRRLGRVRLAVADRPGSLALVDWAASVIEPGSTIKTDGAPVLRRLADRGFVHHATPAYRAADQSSVLPGVHLVASLLKRWLIGTLHYRVEQQHLPYYLDEYTFRFNRRTAASRGLLFYRLLQQAVNTDPHPLRELLKPGQGSWDDFT